MDRRALAGYAYHNCEFVHAINLLRGEPPTAETAVLHIKALCELDEKAAAVEAAETYLDRFGDSGQLHYYCGMARYLAGASKAAIESAFLAAAERQYPGASMGLAFLEFAAERATSAIELLGRAASEDRELEHIRLLMLFQVRAAAGDLPGAETHLREADRLLCSSPSLLRQFWGHLCWVRLLMAKGQFAGAEAVLQRILDQLDEHLMPRLHRNALEARRMIESKIDEPNIILPKEHPRAPARDGAPTAGRAGGMAEITRKPMLHSLFSFLSSKGERGATKEDIVTSVWEETYNPLVHDDRIYKAIGRLRRLLGDDQQAPRYLTQLGRSYVLNLPATPDSAQETP
jgi:tetratricopeptide (TPR) repeat protein